MKLLNKLLLLIIFLSINVFAQPKPVPLNNPNNLPICPAVDESATTDEGRRAGWNNCWGRYVTKFNADIAGTVTEAEWKKGDGNGKGNVFFKGGNVDGDIYVGDLKHNLFNGKGVYDFKNGQIIYVGDFKDDSANGKGAIYYYGSTSKVDRYEGDVKDWGATGQGIMYFKNGDIHAGEFLKGQAHGRGVKSSPDGIKFETTFNKGYPVDGKIIVSDPSGQKTYATSKNGEIKLDPALNSTKSSTTQMNFNNMDPKMRAMLLENMIGGCPEIRNACAVSGNYNKCMEIRGNYCRK